jgi:hypothetical protein
MPERKIHLGDGAYAEFDGYSIRLFTSDGINETNNVILEPEVMLALQDFAQSHGVI